jgi:hypothetical protein
MKIGKAAQQVPEEAEGRGIDEKQYIQANEPWLGAVPADWTSSRIRNIAALSPGYSDGSPLSEELCAILLYAEGYRPEKNLQHYRTIQALPLILGKGHERDAKYLDICRNKRNVVEYEYVGGVTEEDVLELIEYVNKLRDEVLRWLNEHHAELI